MNLLQEQGRIDDQLQKLRQKHESVLLDKRYKLETLLETAKGDIRMKLLEAQGNIDRDLVGLRTDGEIRLQAHRDLAHWNRLGERIDSTERIEEAKLTQDARNAMNNELNQINMMTDEQFLKPGGEQMSPQEIANQKMRMKREIWLRYGYTAGTDAEGNPTPPQEPPPSSDSGGDTGQSEDGDDEPEPPPGAPPPGYEYYQDENGVWQLRPIEDS